jgi:DNA-binding response OmpR family regulator
MPKAKILVVEDEWLVGHHIQLTLEDLGYTVVGLTASGDEALRLAEEHLPELVLMDISLEGDMDGIEAAESLGQELEIPVIFLTAFSDPQVLGLTTGANLHGFIMKPFEILELRAAIENALQKSREEKRLQHLDRG